MVWAALAAAVVVAAIITVAAAMAVVAIMVAAAITTATVAATNSPLASPGFRERLSFFFGIFSEKKPMLFLEYMIRRDLWPNQKRN